MIVKRGSNIAYDAKFHSRLNVIRGENSSGKSTILDFIFYALGGEISDWREAALACSEVVIEVDFNGRTAVLAREISQSVARPMRIFFGSFVEAEASLSGWAIHPYKRSENKESFSQVLFRLMGMPEATGDTNSNITMHQLLRLLYADQLSPVDRIFRFERFDTALTRKTTGDLLCGAYDNSLYRQQLRLRVADKEYIAATDDWRSALTAFEGERHDITMEWIESERSKIKLELMKTYDEAQALEEKIFNAEVSDGLSLKEQEHSYAEIVNTQAELLSLRAQRDSLQLEIADSDDFISSLDSRLDQLTSASSVAAAFKSISFIYCPSCMSTLDQSVSDHTCALCKTPFDQDRARSRILAAINETGLQAKQSRVLQGHRAEDVRKLDERLSETTSRWNGLSERYRLLNRLPSTELRSKARSIYNKAGYLERQLEDLGKKVIIIERIEALSQTRQLLNKEITNLKDGIETSEIRQRAQLVKAYSLISKNTAEFLRKDLLRQDTFSKANDIQFSFEDDRLAVNGESFFSASSMVYLRNSFFAGFLKSAMQDELFRHPRLLILDTIEDKGMEPERSHHFQNLLAKMSEDSTVEHQLIFATAMISPGLEQSEYLVDRFYTHNDRTLKLAV